MGLLDAVAFGALERMESDGNIISALRAAPRRATDRLKPNDELLAEIDTALQAAGVPRKLWHNSVPQPPQREPDSPYKRLTTRLYFEGVTLRQLVAFSHRLLKADPALFLSATRITTHRQGTTETDPNAAPTWNVEPAVSYPVYAPKSK